MLLKELCSRDGVSGNEKEVRAFILEQIRPYADDIKVDTMGNIIARKNGKNSNKRVMLSAHMDEVGLIISGVTERGFLRFKTVGGIDARVLISKRVRIGQVKGIIGMKAIHLQKKTERENVPEIKDIYIDIGAKDKDDALRRVHIGDYASFDTEYSDFGTDKVKAKALDDRIGCAVLIDMLRQECDYDCYFCFLVQEEVGLRGAQIAAYRIKPDIALVLESTTCSDVYGSEEHEYATTLGEGVVVTFMDRSTIVNQKYYQWLYKQAQEHNISVQYKRTGMGGNDAGAIHKSGTGVLTAALSVPCRYIHSPVSVASKSDIDAMYALTRIFIEKVGELL